MYLLYTGNNIKELENIGFKEDENSIYPKYMVKGDIYVKSEKTYQLGHKCKYGLLELRREEGHRVFTRNNIDDEVAQDILETGLFREVSQEEMKTYNYRGF